ncbi:hypothetical protein ACFVIM_28150 [Streptomyces sp. NPDC057638]|uniref:hypothetical protein n=1 Tax=Streptomyces sp. NPDC057638 TaxID=3346190 RepID=UPI0036A5C754
MAHDDMACSGPVGPDHERTPEATGWMSPSRPRLRRTAPPTAPPTTQPRTTREPAPERTPARTRSGATPADRRPAPPPVGPPHGRRPALPGLLAHPLAASAHCALIVDSLVRHRRDELRWKGRPVRPAPAPPVRPAPAPPVRPAPTPDRPE